MVKGMKEKRVGKRMRQSGGKPTLLKGGLLRGGKGARRLVAGLH
jgi:hypothetical protein